MIETTAFEIMIYGHPEPAGSKRAIPIYRRGGSMATRANGSAMVNVVDANPKSRSWKNIVATLVREAFDGMPMRGPLRMYLTFYRVRPKSHRNTKGELTKAGRESGYPTTKPDVLKLARAVEDALTGIVYNDDAQIVEEDIRKYWGEREGVRIVVEQIKAVI